MTDRARELVEQLQKREHYFRNASEGEYDAELLQNARFMIEDFIEQSITPPEGDTVSEGGPSPIAEPQDSDGPSDATKRMCRTLGRVKKLADEIELGTIATGQNRLRISKDLRILLRASAVRTSDPKLPEFLTSVAQLLDEVKMDRSSGPSQLPWNEYHDGLRSELTRILRNTLSALPAEP